MKLLFNHIAKTGGDSVHEILGRVLGDYYADLNRTGLNQIRPATSIDQVRNFTRSPNLLALGMHITTPNDDVRQELMQNCLGVAIVRDPLDRLESFYLYARRSPHIPIHDMAVAATFDEFHANLQKMAHHFVYPSQRVQLLYEPEILIGGARPDKESLEHVMAFLSRHYLLVGTTDNMALFYNQLQTVLRRLFRQPDLTLPEVRKNTREEGQSATLSPAVQDVMKQHCAPDVRLHEHLRQLGGYFNEPLLDAVTRQLG